MWLLALKRGPVVPAIDRPVIVVVAARGHKFGELREPRGTGHRVSAFPSLDGSPASRGLPHAVLGLEVLVASPGQHVGGEDPLSARSSVLASSFTGRHNPAGCEKTWHESPFCPPSRSLPWIVGPWHSLGELQVFKAVCQARASLQR